MVCIRGYPTYTLGRYAKAVKVSYREVGTAKELSIVKGAVGKVIVIHIIKMGITATTKKGI